MIPNHVMKELSTKNDAKIVLLVMDGVGGLPIDGKTELETANTPNLDNLAAQSSCGLTNPISPGITPGSGPAHLSLFGYDPLGYEIGRGVLEALGLGIDLGDNDLAARANFASMDAQGRITDRRAGRIPTEMNLEICQLLRQNITKIEDVEVKIQSGMEHRFVVVFTGEGLSGPLSESDPQQVGLEPLEIKPLVEGAKKAARIVNQFVQQVKSVLQDKQPANMCLMRGLAKSPNIPSMHELFKLTPAAIATYPMYNGLAKLVGMEILSTGSELSDQVETMRKNWDNNDFFFVHVKKTDSYGEDGNFAAKVKKIEETDAILPDILALNPDVVVVTSDHSTPAVLKNHSWHPNPFMIHSKYCLNDQALAFNEHQCMRGCLGTIPAYEAIPLMLANAFKLKKFGA